jgi:hypothetical protein
MALALNDRVQQTGTANTTVSFTLTGSVTGFQSFAVVGNGNTTYYSAFDATGNWEVGVGTYSTTGPTLTRTTILSSSNSGSAVTFVGSVNVFVTYPSSKSVNLDGSNNVSALGTVSSGTWQGSTVAVAYGGTGVTASSGANSVMLRDANQNVAINRLSQSTTTVTAAGGTTTLTVASTFSWVLNGTGGQTFRLPDATTLTATTAFEFNNNATGTLTIVDNASGAVGTVAPGGAASISLLTNVTVAGLWDVHAYIPESVTWGTNALALGSTVISGGTWQGGTIQSGYGGTGLTTFTGANNALYSTSASALAAGTLPVAAGGTGLTSAPANGALDIGNGTGFTRTTLTQGTGITITNGTGSITIASAVTSPIPAGTVMIFKQTAAPTGWTKDTTAALNDSALRIVTGTVTTGGSVAFSTAFASQSVSGTLSSTTATNQNTTATGTVSSSSSSSNTTATNQATTISTSTMPSHNHALLNGFNANLYLSDGRVGGIGGGFNVAQNYVDYVTGDGAFNLPLISFTGSSGSHNHGQDAHNHPISTSSSFTGTAHTHTQDAHTHTFTGTAINLAVKYIDFIIASKD